MRASIAGWMILSAVLALSAGALAGSGSHRRQGGMAERLAQAEAALQEREALIASLTADLDRLRDEADASRMNARAVEAALRTNQRLLDETSDQLRQAEDAALLERQDMRALEACLTGTLHALQAMAAGDSYGAMSYMVAVDGECRAAYRLLNLRRTN